MQISFPLALRAMQLTTIHNAWTQTNNFPKRISFASIRNVIILQYIRRYESFISKLDESLGVSAA
jgi:hypothetical protein